MSTNSLVKSSCISVVLALFSLFCQAQPVANFSATPLSGCAPLLVNFTDLSTGNPAIWKWDLGNGTVSILKNPSVTYFNPGQYNVKLVVQNANGNDSVIKSQYITIYAQPTINFSASITTGCFPLPVQFTDNSTAGSGTITQWEWDFGDGNLSSLQNPGHVYNSSGNFNVSLRVTNSKGCVKTYTRLQYIQLLNGVKTNFTPGAPSSCSAPASIQFQNLSLGTGTVNYKWNFGDGGSSTQANPFYTYNNPGTYTVTLMGTNNSGCSDTIIRTNIVTIGSVHADFTTPASVCIGTPFTFTNTSSPVPTSAIWAFGDGTTSTSINPVMFYAATGIYNVKLVTASGGCIDSIIKPVTVLAKSISQFTASPLASCQVPVSVNFVSASINASTHNWNFGDGTTSTQTNPSHSYTTPGNYTITLITTNSFGCADTLVRSQYINVAFPAVTIANLPVQGCAPLVVPFSANISSPEPALGYLWEFGDGTTSTASNPTHTFATGIYDIKLTIVTASGCTATVLVTEGVKAGVKPVANFVADPRNVCARVPINFTDSSLGTVNQWFWEFGDGGVSTLQNPTYIYVDTGDFHVQLIVKNNGCPDTIKFFNYIHIDPPVAVFSYAIDCGSGGKRVFTDLSIGADTWNWDFGDGATSTQQHPVHVYTSPGTYTATLVVTNFITGCSYETSAEILIFIASADFSAIDTVICKNSTAVFSSSGASQYIISYEWNYGDSITGTGANSSHVYPFAGLYDVTLITTDINGCRDTLLKQGYIRVDGPTANFGLLNPSNCSMSAVVFTDSSLTDGLHPISRWVWTYGDTQADTLQSPPFQHTYNAPGIYSISLKITDTEGCVDSILKTNELIISQPIANFNADTLSCPGINITFNNLSTGPGLTYAWNFGDGATSTLKTPVHSYAADGLYTVKLSIFDQYGCSNTLIKNNYIRITTPLAKFSISDSMGTCPPLVVNFINSSINYTSLLWDFGDGSTSQTINPFHFYSTPGAFTASLTVYGPTGCTSVVTRQIFVRGPQGTFTYSPLLGCDSVKVNFIANTRNRHSFIWDFNDGSTLATTDSIVSHTYRIRGSYVPKMILIDLGGCVVPITGPDTIRVVGADANFNLAAFSICDTGSVSFNNTSGTNDGIASFTWNFGDGNTSTLANPVHVYQAPGMYYPQLTVTTTSGCKDSMRLNLPVKIYRTPQGLVSQSANGCTPVTVTFKGSLAIPDSSALTWDWSFGNGQTSSLQNPLPQRYNIPGTYNIKMIVVNEGGCKDTVVTTIDALALPAINAGADFTICQNKGTQVQATGAVSYVWDATPGLSCYNCANPVATPDSLTMYVVTGTNALGCTKKDSVMVNVKFPFNMVQSPPDTLCRGGYIRLQASGAHSYQWSPATGLSSATIANPIAAPGITTVYRVIGTDNLKCFSDTAYVPIKVFPIPTVEAGPDRTINVGEITDLVPELSNDVTKVIWSPTGAIFRNSYPAITVKPKETTTYRVEVSNNGGCIAADNITIHVICNGANVFIPNTFTPNNDGANDRFYPRGSGLFSIKSARVFNRWGEIMYERSNFQANDAAAGWDGTFKGVKLNPDIYVYVIEILCDNNTVLPFKGNIALLK